MKKIMTTIALIMAFALTAFASHDNKRAANIDPNAPTANAMPGTTPSPGTGHAD